MKRVLLIVGLFLIASFTFMPRVRADTEDNFPSSETATKGNANGAAFPGSIQTSDDSYRNLNEGNQAPNDINVWVHPIAGTSSYFNTWDSLVGDGVSNCAATTHYGCVDEDPNDGVTTYVATATGSEKESHLMEDVTITAGFSDIDVTAEMYCRKSAPQGGGQVALFIRETDGTPTEVSDAAFTCPQTTFTVDTFFRELAPGGAEWTAAEINAMECGYSSGTDVSPQPHMTSVRCNVVVTYPADYEVEIKYDWTGVSTTGNSWTLVTECKRTTNPENILVQVLTPPSTWNTRYTCDQDTDTTYNTYALDSNELNSGSPSVRFLGSSESGDSASSIWDIDVLKIVRDFTPSNSPPTITIYGVSPSSGPRDTEFSYFSTYTDSDNDAPTYMNIEHDAPTQNHTMNENNTGDTTYTDGKAYYFDETPSTFCPGSISFFFSTSDGTASIRTTPSGSFTVTNTVPVITNEGGAPVSVVHGNTYSYDFEADDLDVPTCQTLSWSKVSGPSWLSVSSGTGVLSGLAPDDTSQGGSITVRASDGTGQDDFGFTITITNSDPSFTSGVQSSENADNGTAYTHDYNAVDTDPNDDLYYTMETNNSNLQIGGTNGTVWGFLSIIGTFYVNVTVHDQAIPNGTDSNNYTLIVSDPPFIVNARFQSWVLFGIVLVASLGVGGYAFMERRKREDEEWR